MVRSPVDMVHYTHDLKDEQYILAADCGSRTLTNPEEGMGIQESSQKGVPKVALRGALYLQCNYYH